MQAKGTFQVQMTAEPPYSDEDGVSIGRAAFTKQFTGDLVADSKVDMIGARTPEPTSAGYVAIERIVGTLAGKRGTFVLQHTGVMDRGGGSLKVTVVPDSGTGELRGLRGEMTIEVIEKIHNYTLTYEL